MYEAVMKKIELQDLIMSGTAVADFRPKKVSTNKNKKNNKLMTIEITENRDSLASVCQVSKKPICIGFAAETENFISNAKEKLESKMCEAIILNDISQSEIGLNSDENEVHFITKENCEKIEKNSKQIIAEKVIQKITNYFF